MNKTVIHFDDTQFAFCDAAFYVGQVVNEGRVSENDSYCAVVTFQNGVVVHAWRTKAGTDTFRVLANKTSENQP